MENNNFIENFMNQFTAQKSRVCIFVFAVLSAISSFLFIAEMSLSTIPLIFTMCILLASVANIVYAIDVSGKNKYGNDCVLLGIAISVFGLILRIIQLGIMFSLQYFIAYTVFYVTLILLGVKLSKNKGKENIIIILLIVSVLYNIFEFFYANASFKIGFVWKIYHISEALLFLEYISLLIMNKGLYEDFTKKIGKYKNQIPSSKICIAILLFIAVISIGIGILRNLDNKDFSLSNNQTKSDMTETKESTPKPTSTPTPTPTTLPEQTLSLGQTITTPQYEFTLNKVELSYDVMPDNPPSYYSHYTAGSGQVYIYINATVKNLQKQDVECDEIYSVTADYNNGYTYNGFNITDDSDGDFTYANITSISPLQTLGVHCLIECPAEVETSNNPLSLSINLKNGTQYKYTVR